ncbi:hypothetical protein [Verrucomicrobium spinosum]|uniref:hypothetical protein n=1 Tax=Verrucomicrobium spinosum TaxID=2736 RepID=UPI000AD1964B|nr:hypothetical protein [Verrucomicrobium spinosum]
MAHDWDAFWEAHGSLAVVAAGIHPDDVPAAVEFLAALQLRSSRKPRPTSSANPA